MQPIAFQVVADAEDPHGLARFWADALGWTLEDNDAFVRSALKAGYATGDDVVELDGRKFWRTVAAIRHPDDPYHPQRGSGLGRRMLFQLVPEHKQVKNRWHLDLNVGREHINTTVSRLRRARRVPHHDAGSRGQRVLRAMTGRYRAQADASRS